MGSSQGFEPDRQQARWQGGSLGLQPQRPLQAQLQQQQRQEAPLQRAHQAGGPAALAPPAAQQQLQQRQFGQTGEGWQLPPAYHGAEQGYEGDVGVEELALADYALPPGSAQMWTASGTGSSRPRQRTATTMPPPPPQHGGVAGVAGVAPHLPAAVQRYQALSSQASVAQPAPRPLLHKEQQTLQQRPAGPVLDSIQGVDEPCVVELLDDDDDEEDWHMQPPLQHQHQHQQHRQQLAYDQYSIHAASGADGTAGLRAEVGEELRQRPGSAVEHRMGLEAELSVSADGEDLDPLQQEHDCDQEQQEHQHQGHHSHRSQRSLQQRPLAGPQPQSEQQQGDGRLPDACGEVLGSPPSAPSPDYVVQDSFGGGQGMDSPPGSVRSDGSVGPRQTACEAQGKSVTCLGVESAAAGKVKDEPGIREAVLTDVLVADPLHQSGLGPGIKPDPGMAVSSHSGAVNVPARGQAVKAVSNAGGNAEVGKGTAAAMHGYRPGSGQGAAPEAALDADLDADLRAAILRRKSAGGGAGDQTLILHSPGVEQEEESAGMGQDGFVPCATKRGWGEEGDVAGAAGQPVGVQKRQRTAARGPPVKQDYMQLIQDIKLEEVDEEEEEGMEVGEGMEGEEVEEGLGVEVLPEELQREEREEAEGGSMGPEDAVSGREAKIPRLASGAAPPPPTFASNEQECVGWEHGQENQQPGAEWAAGQAVGPGAGKGMPWSHSAPLCPAAQAASGLGRVLEQQEQAVGEIQCMDQQQWQGQQQGQWQAQGTGGQQQQVMRQPLAGLQGVQGLQQQQVQPQRHLQGDWGQQVHPDVHQPQRQQPQQRRQAQQQPQQLQQQQQRQHSSWQPLVQHLQQPQQPQQHRQQHASQRQVIGTHDSVDAASTIKSRGQLASSMAPWTHAVPRKAQGQGRALTAAAVGSARVPSEAPFMRLAQVGL